MLSEIDEECSALLAFNNTIIEYYYFKTNYK